MHRVAAPSQREGRLGGHFLPRAASKRDCRCGKLIPVLRSERVDGARRILLGIICEASLPAAFLLLMEYLRSSDERLRSCAVEGLRRLDTPETRKVLWKAGYLVPTKTVG